MVSRSLAFRFYKGINVSEYEWVGISVWYYHGTARLYDENTGSAFVTVESD